MIIIKRLAKRNLYDRFLVLYNNLYCQCILYRGIKEVGLFPIELIGPTSIDNDFLGFNQVLSINLFQEISDVEHQY